MAILTICDQNRTLSDEQEIRDYLVTLGIDYERWPISERIADDEPAEKILEAYASEIEKLKASGGYVTADIIDVGPDTPGLEEMLAKFDREHWHDEDEVRFIISGSGIFHIHGQNGEVVAIEVNAGDLIRVPRGTLHWFNLCADRRIRAIRLFQDKSGWTPQYTGSHVDQNYMPICFGRSHCWKLLHKRLRHDRAVTRDACGLARYRRDCHSHLLCSRRPLPFCGDPPAGLFDASIRNDCCEGRYSRARPRTCVRPVAR